MRYLLITTLIAIVACTSSPRSSPDAGPGDTDTDSASDTDTGEFVCHGGSTEVEPIVWTLPEGQQSDPRYDPFWRPYTPGAECEDGDGAFAYNTLDLTEDGLPDLVFSDDCVVGGVGAEHFVVMPGTVGEYASKYTMELPTIGQVNYAENDPFDYTVVHATIAGPCLEPDRWFYGLWADLTGDGYKDIVLTSDCAADSTVGVDHWLLFAGTEVGWEAVPIGWQIPGVLESPQWDNINLYDLHLSLDAFMECGEGQNREALLFDVDGDQALDLVVIDACDAGGVGASHWEVYRSDGAGFATSAESWELPSMPGLCEPGVDAFVTQEGCVTWVPRDIDGDGLFDLVVFESPEDDAIGTEHWLVFRNYGSQFATDPIYWSLPLNPWDTKLSWNSSGVAGSHLSSPTSGIWLWLLRELTGDGRVDLMLSNEGEEGGVGDNHWLVYVNEGDGFAEEPLNWCFPPPPDALPPTTDPYAHTDGYPCDYEWGRFLFDLRDFDGDSCADLVVYDDCNLGGVGDDHWLVYPLPCLDIP